MDCRSARMMLILSVLRTVRDLLFVCVCGKKYEAAAVHNAPFHTHIDGIVAQSSR